MPIQYFAQCDKIKHKIYAYDMYIKIYQFLL